MSESLRDAAMFTNSIFQKDPFFARDGASARELDRADRLMSEFWHPHHFPREWPMMPAVSPPLDNEDGRMRRYREELETIPLGRPRTHGDMFRNMENMFNESRTVKIKEPTKYKKYRVVYPTNVQSYSSSKISTYTSDGVNEPKRYEAISETTQGPNGVRQTLNRERNSTTGQDRMQAGRYIYDRGHVVEKTENMNANDVRINHDYYNMEQHEKDAFHQEWNQKVPSPPRFVLTRMEGLDPEPRRLLKWQHGFSRNYDGTDFNMDQRKH